MGECQRNSQAFLPVRVPAAFHKKRGPDFPGFLVADRCPHVARATLIDFLGSERGERHTPDLSNSLDLVITGIRKPHAGRVFGRTVGTA